MYNPIPARQPAIFAPASCSRAVATDGEDEFRTRQREQAEQDADLVPETTARHEHQPFAPLRELVGELHDDAAPERLADEGRALVPERHQQVAHAARERAERVVAARLLGRAVTDEIGGDDGEALGQLGHDVPPRRRVARHAVDEDDHGPGARRAIADPVAVDVDVAQLDGRGHRSPPGAVTNPGARNSVSHATSLCSRPEYRAGHRGRH